MGGQPQGWGNDCVRNNSSGVEYNGFNVRITVVSRVRVPLIPLTKSNVMRNFNKTMPLRQGFLYVMIVISAIFLLIMLSSATEAQNITQDPLYGQKFKKEMTYFRVVAVGNTQYMIDMEGTIVYNKGFFILKSNQFGNPDVIIKIENRVKGTKAKVWYGKSISEDKQIYIKLIKNEVIVIYYIEDEIELYFLDTTQKEKYTPLPNEGVWYQNKD